MAGVEKDPIATKLKTKLGRHFDLRERLPGLYQVFAPFYHTDGDMIDLFLKVQDDQVRIMDMGVTLMHLSYDLDISSESRQKQFRHILEQLRLEEEQGNLYVDVPLSRLYPYLMHMYGAMVRISAMDMLKTERIRSHFMDDVRSFLLENLGDLNPQANAYFSEDEKKEYPIDLLIRPDGKRPICIFPVSNDSQAKSAVIVLQHFADTVAPWGLAIYENMKAIGSKENVWLTNAADKQYASFYDNQDKIISYVRRLAS